MEKRGREGVRKRKGEAEEKIRGREGVRKRKGEAEWRKGEEKG